MPRTRSTPFEASGPNTTVPGLQDYIPRHMPQTMDIPRFSSNSAHDDPGSTEANFSLYSHLPQANIPQHQLAVADWIDSTGVGDYDPTPFLTDEALSCQPISGTQQVEPAMPLSSEVHFAPGISRRLSSEASTFDYGDYSQPLSSNTESSPVQHGLPLLSQQSSMSCSEPFDTNGAQFMDSTGCQLDSVYATSPLDQFQDTQFDDLFANQATFAAGQQDDPFNGSSAGESSYPSPPQDASTIWDAGPYQPQPCRTVSLPLHPANPTRQQMVSPPLSEPSGNFSLVSSAPRVAPMDSQYQALTPPCPAYGHPVTFTEPVLSATTPQNFTSATVKASRPTHRPILSASERKPSPSYSEKDSGHETPSEPAPPRNHHWYKKGPNPDGLYHCPYAEDGGCGHKPTPQKCAYDKYLDSHLKPYRCKDEKCSKLEFSSNACLFRHEREAHGMHGHGDNPYVCHFPDCDRSKPGGGFPRRWNLRDHQRRVHDYDAAKEEKQNATSMPKHQSSRINSTRKRKASNGVVLGSVAMKRSTSSQSKARDKSAAVIQAQNNRRLQDVRQNAFDAKTRLINQVIGMDPINDDDLTSACASFQELQTYRYEIQKLQPQDLGDYPVQYST